MSEGTAVARLDPSTLIKSGDGKILSLRHRVLSGPSNNETEEEASQAITRLVQDGEWAVADGEMPSLRTCLGCGCTDKFGCEGGCRWVGTLLCSACVGPRMRRAAEIEADLAIARDLAEHRQANEAAVRLGLLQVELLLDIRDLICPAADDRVGALLAEDASQRIARAELGLLLP
jgi:hypothetical protein